MSVSMITIAFAVLVAKATAIDNSPSLAARRSPPFQHAFQLPLTIPEVKKPLLTYSNPETGVPIDFYQLEVQENEQSFYPNLNKGKVLTYDGTFPGPSFRAERGRELVVRVVNKANKAVNFHVHGSYTRSPWDGWAEDVMKSGDFKDYYYPNMANSRSLWYHDHSNHENAVNIYRGLFGSYQIVDSKQDTELGIPTGPIYDIPLLFSAHYFKADGDLTDESKERASIYGDTWLVNGQIKPFLAVEPRKYRFRILNGAASRTLNFTLENEQSPTTIDVIGSDGGLRQSPAPTKSLVTGMGERWEIIVDFTNLQGKNLTMRASNMWTDKAYEGMDEVMQFRVGQTVKSQEGNGPLPSKLAVNIRFPSDRVSATREFKLISHMDMMWGINSYHMDDAMQRVLMRPPLGTIEKYIFRSDGMSMGNMGGGSSGGMHGAKTGSDSQTSMKGSGSTHSSHHGGVMMGQSQGMSAVNSGMNGKTMGHGGMGDMMKSLLRRFLPSEAKETVASATIASHSKRQMGNMGGIGGMDMKSMKMGGQWTHAMHLHLVDMKLVSRTRDNGKTQVGRDFLENYEQDSVKDVVLLGSNEKVEVLAKYVPYSGIYMFHCHNMVHEDEGMMAVINVTRLPELNYSAKDSHLEDPMDSRFRPQKYKGTDLEDIKTKVLPAFAQLQAYPDPVKLAELEEKYWADRDLPSSNQTSAQVGGGADPRAMGIHNSHHGSKDASSSAMGGMGSHGASTAMAPMSTAAMSSGSSHGSYHG